MTQDLTGKTAAITGAASGIGLACAQRLLAAGLRVVLIDRDSEALAKVCAPLGPHAIPLVVDLTDPASVAGMLPAILDKAGPLDIFHANAGAYVGDRSAKVIPMPGTACSISTSTLSSAVSTPCCRI